MDRCFRREQAEDAARLMSYYSASCVIMDENVSVEDGKAVADGLLSQFGFEKFQFRPDEKRSKYYVPGTQIEVYAYHPGLVGSATKYKSGWVEVATFGIYSPTALSQYDIPYPVMNLGLGVERMAMILHNSQDVRALSYPQFQTEWQLSAREMAQMITVDKMPSTPEGQAMAEAWSRPASSTATPSRPANSWPGRASCSGAESRFPWSSLRRTPSSAVLRP